MTKKKDKPKRPKDINQLAHTIVAEAVGEDEKSSGQEKKDSETK